MSTVEPQTAAAPVAPPAGPCIVVIFGASGDLTQRKLIPALYNLMSHNLLPEAFAVVGVDRADETRDTFRDRLTREIREHLRGEVAVERWNSLCDRLYHAQGDFQDREAYRRLAGFLQEVDAERHTDGNYLFYLATPPRFFAAIVEHLGEVGLTRQEQDRWRRVIVEKPFGHDLESARALNRDIHRFLTEDQIYRIDHYLGKETVQNILVYRFANGITEPIWNRRYVDHVQITVAEPLGVEHRAGYYEEAGALRDMVSNHLVALLAVTAMEPPNSFDADAVRDEKAKVLRAIQPLSPEDVLTQAVRGQYGAGMLPSGEPLVAYRSEPGVAPESRTETYVALKLIIDNWRWAGVPFYLRTGKRLPIAYTEIAIQFKRAPFVLFRDTPVDHLSPNVLVLRIQPAEGIEMTFGAKVPGPTMRLGNVHMDFCYSDYFGGTPGTGYESLIYDCMNGDATLFKRADNVEAGWALVEPILDVWSALPSRSFPNYPAGSWGPPEADTLLRKDGRQWRPIESLGARRRDH
ncbi:MAG: glucose-6-phosphate dehydrogenase [Gammaproteobacteria bacterium]